MKHAKEMQEEVHDVVQDEEEVPETHGLASSYRELQERKQQQQREEHISRWQQNAYHIQDTEKADVRTCEQRYEMVTPHNMLFCVFALTGRELQHE